LPDAVPVATTVDRRAHQRDGFGLVAPQLIDAELGQPAGQPLRQGAG
jgi:hypothetical protein